MTTLSKANCIYRTGPDISICLEVVILWMSFCFHLYICSILSEFLHCIHRLPLRLRRTRPTTAVRWSKTVRLQRSSDQHRGLSGRSRSRSCIRRSFRWWCCSDHHPTATPFGSWRRCFGQPIEQPTDRSASILADKHRSYWGPEKWRPQPTFDCSCK